MGVEPVAATVKVTQWVEHTLVRLWGGWVRVTGTHCAAALNAAPSVDNHRPSKIARAPAQRLALGQTLPSASATCRSVQVSEPAVSPISKSARRSRSSGSQVWKPAKRQTWKSVALHRQREGARERVW
jgi:hypothetical protein